MSFNTNFWRFFEKQFEEIQFNKIKYGHLLIWKMFNLTKNYHLMKYFWQKCHLTKDIIMKSNFTKIQNNDHHIIVLFAKYVLSNGTFCENLIGVILSFCQMLLVNFFDLIWIFVHASIRASFKWIWVR